MFKIYPTLFFVLVHFSMFCQSQNNGIWTDIGFEKKISEKYTLSLEENVRIYNYQFPVSAYNTDIGINYNINKKWEIVFIYRMSSNNKNNGYFIKHRLSFDINYQREINRFKLSYRNRTSSTKDNYINEEKDYYPSFENRNKLKISYNIKNSKITPFTAIETFHPLNTNQIYTLSELRYFLGLSYSIQKNNKLIIAYLYNKEYENNIEIAHIINLGYIKKF